MICKEKNSVEEFLSPHVPYNPICTHSSSKTQNISYLPFVLRTISSLFLSSSWPYFLAWQSLLCWCSNTYSQRSHDLIGIVPCRVELTDVHCAHIKEENGTVHLPYRQIRRHLTFSSKLFSKSERSELFKICLKIRIRLKFVVFASRPNFLTGP